MYRKKYFANQLQECYHYHKGEFSSVELRRGFKHHSHQDYWTSVSLISKINLGFNGREHKKDCKSTHTLNCSDITFTKLGRAVENYTPTLYRKTCLLFQFSVDCGLT